MDYILHSLLAQVTGAILGHIPSVEVLFCGEQFTVCSPTKLFDFIWDCQSPDILLEPAVSRRI